MPIHVRQYPSARTPDEGLRLGTVRYLPRGVPKAEYAARGYFDLWLPDLAPSRELFGWIKAEEMTDARWREYARRYRAEMRERSHLLELLAALSRRTSLTVGCYCDDERRCHRSLLRELLAQQGAEIG